MRRALFVLCLFFSAFCFAQQNSGFRIIGKVPDPGDKGIYQIQVGAFLLFQNAEEAFERLQKALLNPAYESYSSFTRVVLNGVAARDVPLYLKTIQNTGFIEVIIRIDNSKAADQPPVCPADETVEEETPVCPVPVQEVTRVRETAPRQQQSLPLLSAPENMSPEDGYRIGEEELRRQRTIDFSWDAVEDATSYILTIYQETPQGREQIFMTEPIEQTNFTFDSWDLFENTGTYVWQVEAGNSRQRGRPGENTFILDVPRPGQVKLRDTGILYGN